MTMRFVLKHTVKCFVEFEHVRITIIILEYGVSAVSVEVGRIFSLVNFGVGCCSVKHVLHLQLLGEKTSY